MKIITDIPNTGIKSMNICDSNVDSEVVSICHCNVGLININNLNLINPICTVEYKTFHES